MTTVAVVGNVPGSELLSKQSGATTTRASGHVMTTYVGIALLGVLGVGGLVALPVATVRLPADFFVRAPRSRGLAMRAVRITAGALLVAAGVAMLFLPGPGVLTLVVGLVLLDIPILRRAAISLLRSPRTAEVVNRLRQKAGRPPFELPAGG